MKKTLILVLCLILAMTSLVFGHGMFVEMVGEGQLKVVYDGDDNGVPNADVVLYDTEGAVIEEGRTDENGIYSYDPDLDIARAQASDGMGHSAEFSPEATRTQIPKVPVIIGVFVLAGLIYFLTSRNKNK